MYSVEERDFISYILDKNYNTRKGSMVNEQRSQETNSWKIRLKEEEFVNWIQKCNSFNLFSMGHLNRIQELPEQGDWSSMLMGNASYITNVV